VDDVMRKVRIEGEMEALRQEIESYRAEIGEHYGEIVDLVNKIRMCYEGMELLKRDLEKKGGE